MKDSEKFKQLVNSFNGDILQNIYWYVCRTYGIEQYRKEFVAEKFSEETKNYAIQYHQYLVDNNISDNNIETFNNFMKKCYGERVGNKNTETLQFLEKRED